ncbi:MAG: hypothetical protein QOI67_1149 [Gaiellaceae bacterium]|nr:hypothetical protein [Gaiellaceae bacterium]
MQKMARPRRRTATVFAVVQSDVPSSSNSSPAIVRLFLFDRRAVGVPTQRRRRAMTSTTPPAEARPRRAVVGALAAAGFACQGEPELARPAMARRASARAANASAPTSRGEAPRSAPGVLPGRPTALSATRQSSSGEGCQKEMRGDKPTTSDRDAMTPLSAGVAVSPSAKTSLARLDSSAGTTRQGEAR